MTTLNVVSDLPVSEQSLEGGSMFVVSANKPDSSDISLNVPD